MLTARRFDRAFPPLLALALCTGAPALRAALQETEAISQRLDRLVPLLASDDPSVAGSADRELYRLCFEAGDPEHPERAKVFERAIAKLLGEPIPDEAKALLIRQLESLGDFVAAQALKKVLLDASASEAVREAARRALVANDTTIAKGALRSALDSARGTLLVGVIQAIGRKRDPLAVGPLMDLVRSAEDRETQLAALEALAEIGEISCLNIIEEALADAESVELAALRRAYVRLADSLVENDERGTARRIYIHAMTMGPEMRSAALVGVARAELQSEIPKILSAFEDADPEVRSAAFEAAAVFRVPRMTQALIERFKAATGELRIDLARALANHGGEAVAHLLADEAANGTEDESRIASAEALGRFERLESDVLSTLVAAAGEEGAPARAIERTLARFPAPQVTAALAKAAADATGSRKAALLAVLGTRGADEAIGVLVAAAGDSDPGVRAAAFRALGSSEDERAVAPLVRAAKEERGDVFTAAASALARLVATSKRDVVTQAIAEGRDTLSADANAALVRALRGDDGALRVFLDAARDERKPVRLAGVAGLGSVGGEDAHALLLELSESADPDIRREAVVALLDGADRLAPSSAAGAERFYLTLLERAGDPPVEERILRSLAEVGGPDAVEAVVARLGSETVGKAAGRAAVRLAERLADSDRERAIDVYRRVIDTGADERTVVQCARHLARLGVRTDLARRQGFITDWHLLGPIEGQDLIESQPPFAIPVETTTAVRVGDKELHWKEYAESHPLGRVDLAALLGDGVQGAWLRAQIELGAEQDATFRIGSDDQIAVWLNGERVHMFRGQRGLTADEDSVAVHLREGANEIVLLVVNLGGGWEACLRVTDRDGEPIAPNEPGGERP